MTYCRLTECFGSELLRWQGQAAEAGWGKA